MFDERCAQVEKNFADGADGLRQMFETNADRLDKTEQDTVKASQEAVQAIIADDEKIQQGIAADNLKTRQKVEDQTNHEIALINKLGVDVLARLHDAEAVIASLKAERSGNAKTDRQLAQHIKEESARLFDPDAHPPLKSFERRSN